MSLLLGVLVAVAAELKAVLDIVQPVVKPVTTLALGLVGNTVGPVADEIKTTVAKLEVVVPNVIVPLQKAISNL